MSSLRSMHCWDRVPKGGGHEPSLEGREGLFITSPERAGFTYATDQTTGGTPSSRQRGTGSRQQHVRQVLSHLKGWGRWPVTALSVLLPKRDSLSDLTTRADRQTAYVQDFIFGLKL